MNKNLIIKSLLAIALLLGSFDSTFAMKGNWSKRRRTQTSASAVRPAFQGNDTTVAQATTIAVEPVQDDSMIDMTLAPEIPESQANDITVAQATTTAVEPVQGDSMVVITLAPEIPESQDNETTVARATTTAGEPGQDAVVEKTTLEISQQEEDLQPNVNKKRPRTSIGQEESDDDNERKRPRVSGVDKFIQEIKIFWDKHKSAILVVGKYGIILSIPLTFLNPYLPQDINYYITDKIVSYGSLVGLVPLALGGALGAAVGVSASVGTTMFKDFFESHPQIKQEIKQALDERIDSFLRKINPSFLFGRRHAIGLTPVDSDKERCVVDDGDSLELGSDSETEGEGDEERISLT